MNKLFISIFCISSTLTITQFAAETKQQKIEQLFELTNNKQAMSKALEPAFAAFNLTDEKTKQTAVDRYLQNIKKDFIAAYDKFFNDSDIEEMIKYQRSEVGKKFLDVSVDLNRELQKAYSSMVSIIQELAPKPEATNKTKSKCVIYFDDISKGKNETEIKDLFNNELKNDGLTVVKFSATWCGPCKNYVPEFEKVAEELKEVVVGDKKITIKYISTDVDATKIIAQDYSVVSIPATLFFKDGKKIDSQVGYMSSSTLSSKIKELAK